MSAIEITGIVAIILMSAFAIVGNNNSGSTFQAYKPGKVSCGKIKYKPYTHG